MKDKTTKQITDIQKDPFEEYIKLGEPDKADKAYAWQTAVGLQDVDKLRPSEYLLNIAKMYFLELTEKITGAGKGKYQFIV